MTPEQRQNLADFATASGATIKATDNDSNVMVTFAWGDFEAFVETLRGMMDSAAKH